MVFSCMKIIEGNRIGKKSKIKLGCSAILVDENSERILLVKRADNREWCLPGGGMDPGENIKECCIREVYEETGLKVKIIKLIGIYSCPNVIVEYLDENTFQIVAFNFLVILDNIDITNNTKIDNKEILEKCFFSYSEIKKLNIISIHKQRIEDFIKRSKRIFIR